MSSAIPFLFSQKLFWNSKSILVKNGYEMFLNSKLKICCKINLYYIGRADLIWGEKWLSILQIYLKCNVVTSICLILIVYIPKVVSINIYLSIYTALRIPTSLQDSWWPSGWICTNAVINIRLVRLSPWGWPKVGHRKEIAVKKNLSMEKKHNLLKAQILLFFSKAFSISCLFWKENLLSIHFL